MRPTQRVFSLISQPLRRFATLQLFDGATMRLGINILVLTFIAFLAPFSDVLAQEQTAKSPPKAKLSEQVFKNIQVLSGIQADQVVPAMQFMTYALGVECSYCHVEGALEKDDKKPKLTARKMMQMVMAIDRVNFDAKPSVTCYSCHRGSPRPIAIPVISDAGIRPLLGSEHPDNSEQNGPAPDAIISKYVEAVGGTSAISKLASRELRATVTLAGRSLPAEILTKESNKQLMVIHLPNGDSLTAYNGETGWIAGPNGPVHDIAAVEVESARVETDLHLPLDLKRMFSELKSTEPEKVGDREAYVLSAMNSGELASKFYFDEESGLLIRILRFTRSPLGLNPTQIDYTNYRTHDGIKVPFQQTISRPNSRFVIQIQEAKFNVPLEDAKFMRPVAEASTAPVP
jgi:photosynthetic reaction center cytochrome c subunit